MFKYLFVLMIAALLFGCSDDYEPANPAPMSVNGEKAAAKLLQADRDFAAASRATNAAEAFNQFLATDAIGLPSGNFPVFGRDSIYASMKDDADSYVLDWQPQHAEVANSGELGWTWGTYTLTGETGNETQIRYGKYLNIWKKIDGNWRVAVDIGNSNPKPLDTN